MSAERPAWRELLWRAAWPPLGDRRFWLVQALILGVVAGHLELDRRGAALPFGMPDSVTVGLFLIPIVYAALNFGLSGAAASAAWGTLLMAPDLFAVDSPADLWADATVLVLIDVVAVVVGQRVERQLLAQQRTAAALSAHVAAEARYRALFNNSSAPTVVVDGAGRLEQANPAAQELFGPRLQHADLRDLVGGTNARALLAGSPPGLVEMTTGRHSGRTLRPLAAWVPDPDAAPRLQVVLEDLTHELEQRKRARAYAADVLRGQEEERRRVAQEIHDEPLQTLLFVLGRLSAVCDESAVPAGAREELSRLRGVLVGVNSRLKEIMGGLRPSILDDLGLAPSLGSLVSGFARATNIDARLRRRGASYPLRPEIETAIFRISQQALGEIDRQRTAQQVRLTLAYSQRHVTLTLEDDGHQEPEPSRWAGGLGWPGIEERASLLGGTAEMQSHSGKGHRLRVSIPTHRRAPAAAASQVDSQPRVAD